MKLPNQLYINGQWIQSKQTQEVLDPANLEKIDIVSCATEQNVIDAVEAAYQALNAWRDLGGLERATYLRKFKDRIIETAEEAAQILSSENGKSIAEAKAEILYGASYFEVYAGEAQRIHGELYETQPQTQVVVTNEPVGVVAAITPWNFPQAMLARKLAAALAAGCTMVAKPDVQTPFSALYLAKLAEDIHLPKGVLNIVTGDPVTIGKVLMDSNLVRKVSFTGSTQVGKLLAKQGAETLKKLSLELGGNAPFIVFDDADLDKAVAGAMASKYRNAGQTCVCTNRFFVQKEIFPKFKEKLKKEMAKLKLGKGTDSEVQVGPLINEKAKTKVQELLQDAIQRGAHTEEVGSLPQLGGHFVLPTIVEGAPKEARIFTEEIFGPVSVLYEFETEEEVIKLANSTQYGLASYFYSESVDRIHRVRKNLDYGMVGINSGRVSSPWAPFGGVKESGYGREGARAGLEEYLVKKMSIQLI